NLKSSFPLRFPPISRAGKARRAEGGCGGNSARRAQPVPFGYFQTDTAKTARRPEGSVRRFGLMKGFEPTRARGVRGSVSDLPPGGKGGSGARNFKKNRYGSGAIRGT